MPSCVPFQNTSITHNASSAALGSMCGGRNKQELPDTAQCTRDELILAGAIASSDHLKYLLPVVGDRQRAEPTTAYPLGQTPRHRHATLRHGASVGSPQGYS